LINEKRGISEKEKSNLDFLKAPPVSVSQDVSAYIDKNMAQQQQEVQISKN